MYCANSANMWGHKAGLGLGMGPHGWQNLASDAGLQLL